MANASQLEPAHTLPTAAIEEYHSIWFEHPTSGWTRSETSGSGSPCPLFYLTAREALFAPFKGVGSISETGPGLFRVIHLCITAYFTQLSIYITFLPKASMDVLIGYDMEENASRLASRGSAMAKQVNNFTMVGNGIKQVIVSAQVGKDGEVDLLQSFLTNDSLSFYRYHWIAYRKELMQKPKGKTSVRGVGKLGLQNASCR
ncbi:hypothetical protein B0H14DRAFT_2648549 [Mycena olivaceomarginata]|nr:hypothetical protein B0H14DRAFT_2648549 [Mycena olivaceomarginata]